MDILKDRRVVIGAGAVVALFGGLCVAVVIAMGQNTSDDPPPASVGGLMVQPGKVDAQPLDPARPLRCFVGGRLVGEMPIIDCARRNGVATGALDVGVDNSGALTAAAAPGPAPPPPLPPSASDPDSSASPMMAADDEQPESAAPAPARPCWEYAGGGWRRDADGSLNACVQQLFAGQCVGPGAAAYGRWGDRTLRLVLGRVEIAADGVQFRPLTRQVGGCAIAPIGQG
jgi:hypothetical protein